MIHGGKTVEKDSLQMDNWWKDNKKLLSLKFSNFYTEKRNVTF